MFSLQGGPAILSPAEQLSGAGLGKTNTLDIDPFLEKSCARHNTGSYCKAKTTDGVELFKEVQSVINAAAGTLKGQGKIEVFVPLKIDGVLGPKTADLAIEILMASEPVGRVEVWLDDPRSVKTELMAVLLASQPQYAKETFEEIAAASPTAPTGSPTKSGYEPWIDPARPPTEPKPTEPTPTEPTVPAVPKPSIPQPTVAPKMFWTRKKKIVAMAGVGVLALGLLVTVLWMRRRDRD